MVVFLLLFSFFVYATEVTVRVSPKEITPQSTVSLTLSVSLTENKKVQTPQLPKNLEVQSQSRSEQVIQSFSSRSGMQKTIKKLFQYQVVSPQTEGVWTIDSISVRVGKKIYKTSPVKVTVNRLAQNLTQKPFQNIFPRSMFHFPNVDTPSRESLKLKASIPRRSFYLHERIPVEWFLYKSIADPFSLSLIHRETVQPEHFWTEPLSSPQNLSFTKTEKIGSKEYLKSLVSSYVFFPLKTGTLTIDPLKIEIKTMNRNFLFSLDVDLINLESNPLEIKVLPLPTQGRGNFTGAVGSFVMNAQKISKEIRKNDLLSYKIRFVGTGLVQNIKLPPWPKNSDFKVYDVLESQNFSAQKSWKEFEVLLSAKKSGTLRTPEFYWTTFDPSLRSYVTQHIESQKVSVTTEPSLKAEKESYLGDPIPQKQYEIQAISTQISFYKKYKTWIWIILYSILIVLVFYKSRFQLPSRRRNFKKIYKKSYQLCQKKRYREVGALLLNLLDQVWLDVSGSGGREIDQLLEKCPPSVRNEFGTHIRGLVRELEDLSFAPNDMAYQKRWDEVKVRNQIKNFEELIEKLLHFRIIV